MLLGKAISQSVCLDPALYLLNKFAKGNDIKNSLKVFVYYCFNHMYNLRDKMAKVKDYFKVFLHQLPWCISISKYRPKTCLEY